MKKNIIDTLFPAVSLDIRTRKHGGTIKYKRL